MANLKSLAKDTAIYGLSSIVGRFLNYLLVPVYTLAMPTCWCRCTRWPCPCKRADMAW